MTVVSDLVEESMAFSCMDMAVPQFVSVESDDTGDDDVGNALERVSDTFCSKISVSDGVSSFTTSTREQ